MGESGNYIESKILNLEFGKGRGKVEQLQEERKEGD